MKRSNSAPLIPDLVHQGEIKRPPVTSSNLLNRRGMSTSNVSLPTEVIIKTMNIESSPRKQPMSSPLPLSRINSPTSRLHRVEKLKKEENIDERENEKEVQEQILLNKNCDELRIDTEEQDFRHEQMEVWPSQPSPSHQPLSPLASRMMRSRSLTPTSPNSTRPFTYRRSCSPVLRPSSLCFQIGHKRTRDHESHEDMDISPSVPCKRLQLSYPSPLNLSPSVSPLMNNSPLHHSFSRKSSSTQSESTPLSSPSSLLHSTNPFALNYDSGNCEHWQSNSGSNSNCSSSCNSPSVSQQLTGGNLRGSEGMSISLLHSKLHSNLIQDVEFHGHGHFHGSPHAGILNASNQHRHLSPSPGIVISEDTRAHADTSNMEMMTETPTPLSPKGLQFRQKLFPPQSLPSPIPRPLPHISPSCGSTSHSMSQMGMQRGSLMAPPSPKSHQQHPTSSLHHDKHLSPFKSDHLPPGRKILTAAKNRFNHLRQIPDPIHMVTSGSIGSEHSLSGTRFIPGHTPNSARQVISSPLAKLSMSSSLEDGGYVVSTGFVGRAPKRRVSETSVESSREGSLMESDGESLEESVGGTATTTTTSSTCGPVGGEKTLQM